MTNEGCRLKTVGRLTHGPFDAYTIFSENAIFQGFVEFRYNLGSGPAILRSLRKVTDVILLKFYSIVIRTWNIVCFVW